MPADPVPAAAMPPAAAGDLPPRVITAIGASIAALAGDPVAEDDPAARRAAVVIRAIQAHQVPRAPATEG